MRFSRVLLVTVLLGLCFAPSLCLAQDAANNQVTVPKIASLFVNPVSRAPFSATVEVVTRQKLPDGSAFTLKSVSYIARDSLGRTHNESRRLVSDAYEDEPPLTDTHIYDAVTGVSIHLDPSTLVSKLTQMSALPVPNPKSVPDPNPNASNSPVKQVDDLGTRMFKSLPLRGIRQSRGPGDFDEYWYSPDLSIYMSHKHQDAIWEQTVTVAEFDRLEPDPSNFTIPSGYKNVRVVDTVSPHLAPGPSGLYLIGGEVLPPKLLYAPPLESSPQARQAKYGGITLVWLVVNAQGNSEQVHVLQHLEMGLDDQAEAAAEKYKFTPATFRGTPVPVAMTVEMYFRVN